MAYRNRFNSLPSNRGAWGVFLRDGRLKSKGGGRVESLRAYRSPFSFHICYTPTITIESSGAVITHSTGLPYYMPPFTYTIGIGKRGAFYLFLHYG